MAGSVGRGESRAFGTIINEKAQLVGNFFVLAGPHAKNQFLNYMAADQVARNGRQYYTEYPVPGRASEIDLNEKEQEDV